MHEMATAQNRTLKLIGGALQHLSELRQDQDHLETLKQAIDCLPIQTGITISDVQGRIVYVNAVQEDMHGYSPRELLGMDARILSCAGNELPFPHVGMQETSFWNRECIGVRKNGMSFPMLLSSIPLSNDQGRCIGVVTSCEDITRRKESETRIEQLANYDPLTRLPNRALFKARLDKALALSGGQGEELALIFLDLDRFKDLNDSRSHEFGDKVLKEVARRLRMIAPEVDLARVGGDEFGVILPGSGEEEAAAAAETIRAAFATPFIIDGHRFFSSTSIGIALYPGDGSKVEGLFKCADAAMHHAKGQGPCNYRFFSPEMETAIIRRVALENSMRQAMERGEFTLHYQPQWDLKHERLTGVEALLRWESPEFGSVTPAEFIPIAEMSGLIVELGEMVLQTACRQGAEWRERHGDVKVAVNISGRQFSHYGFLDTVARIVAETGIAPSMLELEFTESVIMERADVYVDALRSLKAMGVRVAIDDFGTGYSSLSYLKHFPIDTIKVDRSFIAELPGNGDDAAITEAIIVMAHALKLNVVAEGVENAAQLGLLRDLGCDGAQGYYFASPMTPGELTRYLQPERSHP